MGVRLVVVDDHRLLAEALASALRLRGHRVLAAGAPCAAAAELVIARVPEVCLLGTTQPAEPGVFDSVVLKNPVYLDLVTSDLYHHRTYSMGTVDEKNRLNFYDGMIRVVDPEGREFARYAAADYTEHVAEHVEPWTYMKFPFLKKLGWKGFVDGADSGVYSATPLSRLKWA